MTFDEAKRTYVHRFTMEYVPKWSKMPAPNGKFYAPQYQSDREWYENTVFPPDHPVGPRITDCFSTDPTWPLGQWLTKPYTKGE